MAGNHGFVDGNKRTTLLLLHDLISNSGYELRPLSEEDLNDELEKVIVAAASKGLSIEQLRDWFRLRIEKRAFVTSTRRKSA